MHIFIGIHNYNGQFNNSEEKKIMKKSYVLKLLHLYNPNFNYEWSYLEFAHVDTSTFSIIPFIMS